MGRWRRSLVVAAVVGALAFGIIAGPVLAADQAVTIEGFAFSPATVTVRVGDSVTWTNRNNMAHTATASGSFDSGNIAVGGSFTHTFQAAGTFEYVCTIHPTMQGTVVVRAAVGGAGTTPTPTDTAPVPGDPESDGRILAATLGFLGLVMVAGTIIADRHLRRRAG